ncbi:hypothetical protein [Embleya hyalina]|nr:hypothetical protein [Embleya hyalina]
MASTTPIEVELIGESAEPVLDVPHRIGGGGWAARSAAGELLLMDGRLAVTGSFPLPAAILREKPASGVGGQTCRVDVSPDLRFAAFAVTDRIVVIDRSGEVQWQVTHTVPSIEGTNDVAGCAVFTPDGTSLWAFVPRPTDTDALPRDAYPFRPPFGVDRHVLDVSDWRTTARTATEYRCHSRVFLHPDGEHASYGSFDGHDGWSCRWVRWDNGSETVVVTGWMKPVDIHPSGERWLAHNACELVAGDFRSGTVSTIAVEADVEEAPEADWDDHPYHGYDLDISTACLLTPNLALAGCDSLSEACHRPHLLFRVDPPHVYGPVSYPPTSIFGASTYQGCDVGIAGAGDGTWVTCVPGGRLQRWRLRAVS